MSTKSVITKAEKAKSASYELGITSNDDKQLILDHINIQRLSNNPVEVTNQMLSKILLLD